MGDCIELIESVKGIMYQGMILAFLLGVIVGGLSRKKTEDRE